MAMLQAVLGVVAVFLFALAVRLAMIGRARWDRRLVALLGAAMGLGLIASGRLVSGLIVGAIAGAVAAAPQGRYKPNVGRRRVVKRVTNPAVQKARALLGVDRNATQADIRAAYRQRIASAHPDQGGSAEAATSLTAARDLLLAHLSEPRH